MFPAFRLLASLKVVEIRLPVAVEGPLWEPLAELKTLLGLIITIRHLKAEDCSLGKLGKMFPEICLAQDCTQSYNRLLQQ